MCAGMMSWQTGGIGLWSFSFSPENIHRRWGSTRRKSRALISSQTTLWACSALKQSYLPLIKLSGSGFSESQPVCHWTPTIVIHHLTLQPLEKSTCVFPHFCTYHTHGLPMVPEHPKTCVHQSSADVTLFKGGLTTNDTESIRGGGVGECCGGC